VPARKGSFVRVKCLLLEPGNRKSGIPEDTANVAYEMRVAGYLAEDSSEGDQVQITTVTGRSVNGALEDAQPAYTHTFGPIDPVLHEVGPRVKAWLKR